MREHVQAVRNHIKELAARDYAASLEGDVDLVVLFLPGDPFLAAAFAEDPDLQVEAIGLGVLLATPTTLVALLRTVAIYHQHLVLAENAREIGEVAGTLYDRVAKFGDDLGRAGRGLKTAVDAFNTAVGSFERRILPMGQKLESLKVAEQTKRRLGAPQMLTEGPRNVNGGTGEGTPEESDQ
jgi:DNA recombination protein RmuC